MSNYTITRNQLSNVAEQLQLEYRENAERATCSDERFDNLIKIDAIAEFLTIIDNLQNEKDKYNTKTITEVINKTNWRI